jgi:hypothetical protein
MQVSFFAWENTSKNEGPTHDVIENTTPCSRIASRIHDVYENKRFAILPHDVIEK